MLPVASFHRASNSKDGYAWRCVACFNKDYGIGSAANLAKRSERRQTQWAQYIVARCRVNAKKRGVPFDLVKEDIYVPEVCPVLGIPLIRTPREKTPGTPTIDRHIPALGYIKGNVSVISWRANRLKMDETDPATFELIAAYIRRNAA